MPILREGGGCPVDFRNDRPQVINTPAQATVNVVDTTATQTLTGKTLTNPTISGITPVAYTSGTSLTLTAELHANRVVYVTDAASNYVLPAATGTGNKYTIILGSTQTGAGTIKVASAADSFVAGGNAFLCTDGSVVVVTCAATDDTIDLFGTNNTTGGKVGSIYELWDVASGKWAISIQANSTYPEESPFSATV